MSLNSEIIIRNAFSTADDITRYSYPLSDLDWIFFMSFSLVFISLRAPPLLWNVNTVSTETNPQLEGSNDREMSLKILARRLTSLSRKDKRSIGQFVCRDWRFLSTPNVIKTLPTFFCCFRPPPIAADIATTLPITKFNYCRRFPEGKKETYGMKKRIFRGEHNRGRGRKITQKKRENL